MFYAHVRRLPMVDGNLDLSRGDRLEYDCGSIRRSKADDRGFRAFVLDDKDRGVTYRINRQGMRVESTKGPTFIRANSGLKYTPFAESGDEAEINGFLSLCSRLTAEHDKRTSVIYRLQCLAKEPAAILIIAGAVVYAGVTVLVLFFG